MPLSTLLFTNDKDGPLVSYRKMSSLRLDRLQMFVIGQDETEYKVCTLT